MAKAYFNLKKFELFLFPALGILSTYDMCQSWLYNETCSQIFMQNALFNFMRGGFLFYVAYIAKSYFRRIERGEFILV